MIEALIEPTFESWQEGARHLLGTGTPPERVFWVERGDQASLPVASEPFPQGPVETTRVPRRFLEHARVAACHRAADRWTVLYRVLWRVTHEGRALLNDPLDPDAARFRALVTGVRHDLHRMLAFVRFRQVRSGETQRLVAWYSPDHDVAALAAPHFAERYPGLQWSIVTPQASVHWIDGELTFAAGVPTSLQPREGDDQEAEALWRVYYAAVFNPARLNESKLRRDMPERFWGSLPEAREIPDLVRAAPSRAADMRARSGGWTNRLAVPLSLEIAELRSAAAGCQACPLHERGTRTVFGEGPATASLMLVGEQPGDAEDTSGRPFVGPAGEMLDRALAEAGISRAQVYLTNAVKHFGWEPRGKRRIHRTPRLSEVQACRPWLEREIASIRPRVLVLLGGTAARALLGPQARVTAMRGTLLSTAWAPSLIVTFHPSAVLRAADPLAQDETFGLLVADLRLAAEQAAAVAQAPLS